MKDKKVVVLLSGGIDSAVLAGKLRLEGYEVIGLFISYDQPWNRKAQELDAVNEVVEYLNIPLRHSYINTLGVDSNNFVPMRNAALLSVACNEAYSLGISEVAIGCNHCEYGDQSGEFVDRFNFMLDVCFKKDHPYVLAPFCSWSKERVIRYGKKMGFPMEITRSCLSDGDPCGKCISCKLRRKYGIQ